MVVPSIDLVFWQKTHFLFDLLYPVNLNPLYCISSLHFICVCSLFFKQEMELSLIGLQNAGKTSLVNVVAVSALLGNDVRVWVFFVHYFALICWKFVCLSPFQTGGYSEDMIPTVSCIFQENCAWFYLHKREYFSPFNSGAPWSLYGQINILMAWFSGRIQHEESDKRKCYN